MEAILALGCRLAALAGQGALLMVAVAIEGGHRPHQPTLPVAVVVAVVAQAAPMELVVMAALA